MNKKNTSGVTGVHFDRKTNKYRAQISVLDKNIRLGSFQTLQEAETARNNAEEKYKNMDYIEKAVLIYSPNTTIPTAKIIFWIAAYEYFLVLNDHISCFKRFFYNKLKNYKETSIPNASLHLAKLTMVWVGEDKMIMESFIKGKTIAEIAKEYTFSRSQMNRKIIDNLKRLDFARAQAEI